MDDLAPEYLLGEDKNLEDRIRRATVPSTGSGLLWPLRALQAVAVPTIAITKVQSSVPQD